MVHDDAAIDTVVLDDAPIDALVDAPIDAGPTIVSFFLNCFGGSITAKVLCQAQGYSGAGAVRGHGWFQCGGPQERCLGGFVGLTCPDWCATTDCINFPFCGTAQAVTQVVGDGSTVWNALDLPSADCMGGNPGWTIRATCIP